MNDVINIELKELDINYKMYAPNRKTNLIERIVDNTKQPYEYEMLLTMANELCLINPKKNKTILDIGMNIGNHALFFAALGYKVIGIEANPKMSAIAKKSVEINGFEDKIKIIECGASDKDEILYFKEEIPENFGAMHLETKGQGQEIKCRRIDDLGINEEICLLKMDIEGMEAPALRGAKELISKNKPLIYIESQLIKNFNTNADILEALGYIHFFMWDMGAPTHLFRHLDSINESQLAQKFARDSAILRLHSSCTPQGTFIENTTARTFNELAEFKKITLEALVGLLGGKIGTQSFDGKINELIKLLQK